MKVWFQNRRTKHKREETETDQQKALTGGGHPGGHMEDQTLLEQEESEEEDIDCEWEIRRNFALFFLQILWYTAVFLQRSCRAGLLQLGRIM